MLLTQIVFYYTYLFYLHLTEKTGRYRNQPTPACYLYYERKIMSTTEDFYLVASLTYHLSIIISRESLQKNMNFLCIGMLIKKQQLSFPSLFPAPCYMQLRAS